jgi:hypothetical protein
MCGRIFRADFALKSVVSAILAVLPVVKKSLKTVVK